VDPDQHFSLMWIRILIANPDFNADADPGYQNDADPC
jgi:hypothetical protein